MQRSLIYANQKVSHFCASFRDQSDEILKFKKEFNIIVDDKDELIGGRRDDEGQILQPIKHLSGIFLHFVFLLQ